MKKLFSFLIRDLIIETSYKLSFTLQMIGMFPSMLLFYFISKMMDVNIAGTLVKYGNDYFSFVLIGIALQNYLAISLSTFARIVRESQVTGTLEVMLSSPISLSIFLVGSSLYTFLLNSLRIIIYLVFGALLFGVHLYWQRLPVTCLVLIFLITTFSSLGIISAAFIIRFKKGDPLNWIFNMASWLLGGVFYPITILPDWMQKAAQYVPTTHALEILRLTLLANQDISHLYKNIAALVLWSIIGLPTSFFLFRHAVDVAKRNGSLGHY